MPNNKVYSGPVQPVTPQVMSKETRHGGCLCGSVRFTVTGAPLRAGLCHCLDCRKASGSFFSAFAVWPVEAYSGEGEMVLFADRNFCPKCGSRIGLLRNDEAEINLGAFDEAPGDIVPQYELWTTRRESWMHALPWADQYTADRTEHGGDWRQPIVES